MTFTFYLFLFILNYNHHHHYSCLYFFSFFYFLFTSCCSYKSDPNFKSKQKKLNRFFTFHRQIESSLFFNFFSLFRGWFIHHLLLFFLFFVFLLFLLSSFLFVLFGVFACLAINLLPLLYLHFTSGLLYSIKKFFLSFFLSSFFLLTNYFNKKREKVFSSIVHLFCKKFLKYPHWCVC